MIGIYQTTVEKKNINKPNYVDYLISTASKPKNYTLQKITGGTCWFSMLFSSNAYKITYMGTMKIKLNDRSYTRNDCLKEISRSYGEIVYTYNLCTRYTHCCSLLMKKIQLL